MTMWRACIALAACGVAGVHGGEMSKYRETQRDVVVKAVSAGGATFNGTDTLDFEVTLSVAPTADVIFDVTAPARVSGVPSAMTFTASNWNVSQALNVTATANGFGEDDNAHTTAIMFGAATSNDTGYCNVEMSDLTVTHDYPASKAEFVVSTFVSKDVAEGSDTEVYVRLGYAPSANVVVGVSSLRTARLTVDKATLTFTSGNWNDEQTVTVTAPAETAENSGNKEVPVVFAGATSGDGNFSGKSAGWIVFTVVDTADGFASRVPAAGDARYVGVEAGTAENVTTSVKLDVAPTGDVTVSVVLDSAQAVAEPATLGFSAQNYSVAQSVAFKPASAVDGKYMAPNNTVAVTYVADSTDARFNRSGIVAGETLTVGEGDMPAVSVSGAEMVIMEGETKSFKAALNVTAPGAVTVTLSTTAAGVTVAPASAVVMAGSTDVAFTVAYAENTALLGDVTGVVSVGTTSSTGAFNGLSGSLSVTLRDKVENALVAVGAGLPANVSEVSTERAGVAGSASWGVALEKAITQKTVYNLSAANGGTVSPATLTFEAGTWYKAQTIDITAPNDDETGSAPAFTTQVTFQATLDMTDRDTATFGSGNVTTDFVLTLVQNDGCDWFSSINVTGGDALADVTTQFVEGSGDQTNVTFTLKNATNGTFNLSVDGTADALVFGANATDAAANITVPAAGQVNVVQGGPAAGHYRQYAKVVASNANGAIPEGFLCWASAHIVEDVDTYGMLNVTGGAAHQEGSENETITYTVQFSLPLEDGRSTLVEVGVNGTAQKTLTFSGAMATTPQTVDVALDVDTAYGGVGSSANYTIYFQHDNATYPTNETDPTQTVNVTDLNAPIAVMWPGATTVAEGGSVQVLVEVKEVPASDVTVTLAGASGANVTVSPASLMFTTSDTVNTTKAFTVTIDDDETTADTSATLQFADLVGGGSPFDGRYVQASRSGLVLTVTNTDVAPALTLTRVGSGQLSEDDVSTGETFEVTLNVAPVDAVTATFGFSTAHSFKYDDGTSNTTTTEVVFMASDYSQKKTLKVVADVDLVDDGDQTGVSVTAAFAGETLFGATTVPSATASVTDAAADVANLTLSAGAATVDECGGTAAITVKLATKPVGAVTVTAVTGDAGSVLVGPCTGAVSACAMKQLVFDASDYTTEQTVTLTGQNDEVDDGTTMTTVGWQITGLDATYNAVAVSGLAVDVTCEDDDDTAGVVVSPAEVTVAEGGGSEAVVVRLGSKPSGDVQVALTVSAATEVSVSHGALTFTSSNWNMGQTVTVMSVNDYAVDGDVMSSVSMTITSSADGQYNGLGTVAEAVKVTTEGRTTSYLMDYEPKMFGAGQEVRVELQTVFEDASNNGAVTYTSLFNVQDAGALTVRAYGYSATYGTDCTQYSGANAAVLAESSRVGVAAAPAAGMTGKVYATIAAPASEFVICFKHTMPKTDMYVHSAHNAQWALLKAVNSTGRLTPTTADYYYYVSEATVGQYGLVHVLSRDFMDASIKDRTLPKSGCATDVANCLDADNVKIVPAGAECTYEYGDAAEAYLGSQNVSSGVWDASASVGLLEGATAGGVGGLGLAGANPLVDAWSGTSAVVNGSSAIAYVRLPMTAGSYDVCYSNVKLREAAGQSSPGYAVPLWHKLHRCGDMSANCTTTGPSFAVADEPVGWSMPDLTPGTYGDIVFDDSGAAQLDSTKMTNYPYANSSAGTAAAAGDVVGMEYAMPMGGDAFKLVPGLYFGETAGSSGRTGVATAAASGSLAKTGCWNRMYDMAANFSGEDVGGLAGKDTEKPLGSVDLNGDPSAARYGARGAAWRLAGGGFANASTAEDVSTGDAAGQAATFGTVYVPAAGSEWQVCYRRTCNAQGAACAKHSGWRVLPYHYSKRGAVPAYWVHLEDAYTPGNTSTSGVLKPGRYDARDMAGAPLEVTWYTDATRAYGGASVPIAVEVAAGVNRTADMRQLSAQASTYYRAAASAADRIGNTVGTALRLVRAGAACGYAEVYEDIAGMRAEAVNDGGQVECDSARAWTGSECVGSKYDAAAVDAVVFYATLPKSGANYSVCVREGYMNWRKVAARAYVAPAASGGNASSNATMAPPVFPETSSLFSRNNSATFPGHDFVAPLAQTAVTLATFDERRAGYEALIVVRDTGSRLSSADRTQEEGSGGDVLRVVAGHADCSITPSTWTPRLTDLRPGLVCPTPGTGTLAVSGRVCAVAGTANPDLAGAPLYTNRTDILAAQLRAEAAEFDDIVPAIAEFASRGNVSSGVTLPEASADMAGGRFKVCYKMAGSLTWLQFPFEVDQGAHTGAMSKNVMPAAGGKALVSGEEQGFELSYNETEYFAGNATTQGTEFFAKLVRFDATAAGATVHTDSVANKACQVGAGPGSTEGEYGAAATTSVTFPSAGKAAFTLTVPHEPGMYSLCVQMRTAKQSAASWWRPAAAAGCAGGARSCEYSYMVADNGVRWLVGPGSQPTNQGLSVVDLVRCAPMAGGGCSMAANTAVFNTDAGADMAKIVSASEVCNAGAAHVDAMRGSKGVADLGPADGASDIAMMKVVLPRVVLDLRTQYKVCVHTTTNGMARWVEVRQAMGMAGQQHIMTDKGDSAFVTESSHVMQWEVVSEVTPVNSLLTGAGASNVVLAGASSQYVSNAGAGPGATVTPMDGFMFKTYTNVEADVRDGNDMFKLVLAKRPATPRPDSQQNPGTWGDVSTWMTVESDCMDPGVDSAGTTSVCKDDGSGALCPRVRAIDAGAQTTSLDALLHFPLAAGAYRVCFKRQGTVAQPWLEVGSSGADSLVYTHPSFLEMAVASQKTSVSVTDVRTWTGADGTQAQAGSWCAVGAAAGEGADCSGQGFTTDLVTIADGQQVCQVPTSAPEGSGKPDFYQLRRVSNATAVVSEAAGFVMPPAAAATSNTTTGQFKVCVYKAGATTRWTNASSAVVARAGVVFQVQNNGAAANGGGSGYWTDGSTLVARLDVMTSLSFNASEQFVEYRADLEAALAGMNVTLLTDAETGVVSRVPMVDSRETVEFDVQASTEAGDVVPFGSVLVEVLRCPAAAVWGDLACGTPLAAGDASGFAVRNLGGACKRADGDKYGWSAQGLKQHTVGGFARFTLQYMSGCGGSEFGCGVVFQGTGVDLATATPVVSSAAQYVNVRTRMPDGVAINGQRVAGEQRGVAGSASGCMASGAEAVGCYLQKCTSGEKCEIAVQATVGGAAEYAAGGGVSFGFAENDYADLDGSVATGTPAAVGDKFTRFAGQFSGDAWGVGGEVVADVAPALKGGVVSATVFLNVTFGGSRWSRIAVEVTRAQPAMAVWMEDSITAEDVAQKMPVRLGRAPVPLPRVAVGAGKLSEGTYLESLVPYRAEVALRDANGAALVEERGALTGWRLDATVVEAPNAVKVLRPTADAAQSLVTVPELFSAFARDLADGDRKLAFTFRVYTTDNTCSRFGTKGGCTLRFVLSRSGYTDVRADVIAPVRVPASTLDVTVSAASAKVREGVSVTARAGTYVVGPAHTTTFVVDEFHFGEVFTLVDGLAPSDGTTTRDGFMLRGSGSADGCMVNGTGPGDACVVETHALRAMTVASTTSWGAEWQLYGDRPCRECKFTFHTTWGAGPESGTTGWVSAVATVTFEGDVLRLVCNSLGSAVQLMPSGAVWKGMFDLTVTAGVQGVDGANAVYPRSWVYANKTKDVAFTRVSGTGDASQLTLSDGSPEALMKARMVGGVAMFKDLVVTAPNGEDGTTWSVAVQFTAMMPEYGSMEAGSSTVTSQKEEKCTSTVELQQPTTVPVPTTRVVLTGVSGASALCDETTVLAAGEACPHVWATEEQLAAGVGLNVRFVLSNGTDAGARNVTISPRTSGSQPLYPAGPTFTGRAGGVVNSTEVRLESLWNSQGTGSKKVGEYEYTHGAATVVAERAAAGATTSLTLKYTTANAEPAPVREAVFALCATTAADEDAPDMAVVCTDVRLWVTAAAVGVRGTAVFSAPATATFTAGGSGTCGGSAATFSAVAYYTSASVTAKTRFFLYDETVLFTFSTKGRVQDLVVGDGSAGPAATSVTVVGGVGVTGTPVASNKATTDALLGYVQLWGVKAGVTGAVVVTAAPEDAEGLAIGGVETGTEYMWTAPGGATTGWRVSDAVALDTECPTRRRLMTSTNHYRTYGTGVPGAQWGYASRPAAVGLPFPVETVVTSDATGTNPGGRALGFTDGTLVKVTKRSWSACNNGGEMKVHTLKEGRDGTTLLPGTLDSWVAAADNAVPTSLGVATAWPAFAAPCQACTLELELCYTGASAAECRGSFGVNSSDPSDAQPLYSERVKFTKPFAVEAFKADHVQVYAQTLPETMHHVGELFEVALEKVQVFGGGWALTEPAGTGAAAAWGMSVMVAGVRKAGGAGRNTYVNGAIVDGAARKALGAAAGKCVVTEAEFAAGALAASVGVGGGGAASFFFARPCELCEVHVDYMLTPPAAGSMWGWSGVSGSFELRSYDNVAASVTSVAAFTVHACGTKWLFAHTPAVAVRKRTPFALTVMRVDGNHVADWSDAAAALTVDFAESKAAGNGLGGRVWASSPMARNGRVPTYGGSATVRLQYQRACYDCGVTFAGQAHRMTVLTDATKVMAVARDVSHVRHVGKGKAMWTFDVYAADALGDRAFTVAGPTSSAHQNAYATYHAGGAGRKGGKLSVTGVVEAPAGVLANGTRVTAGTPAVSVVSGSAVYNGIPVPQMTAGESGGVGTVTVNLTEPVAGCELQFSMGAGVPTMAGGMMMPPRVSYVPKATLAAVEDMSARKCVVGTPCPFGVYAVSAHGTGTFLAPGASGYGGLRGKAAAGAGVDGTFAVAADCGTCGAPEVRGTMGTLKDGYWMYELVVGSVSEATCTCNVTVTPDMKALPDASVLSFEVTYEQVVLDTWRFGSTSTFMTAGAGGSLTAFASENRVVEVAIDAWDATTTYMGVGGVAGWPEGSATLELGPGGLSPAGCFVCENGAVDEADATKSTCPVTVSADGARVVVRGHFVAAGTCTISGSAVHLPLGASGDTTLATDVTVTVEAPAAVVAVEGAQFTHLFGRTLEGERAAVAGVGSTLTFHVVDAAGEVVRGDNHMEFAVSGVSASGSQWTYGPASVVARGGVATVALVSDRSTRDHCGEANETAPCGHDAWTFTVTASAVLANGTGVAYGGFKELGPLAFVRRATELSAMVKVGGEAMMDLGEMAGKAPMKWQYGRALPAVHVTARDATGVVTSEKEDVGSRAKVLFQAVTPPCTGVDGSSKGEWTKSTCVAGGACAVQTIAQLPACGLQASSGWAVSEERFMLEDGGKTLNATYGAGVSSSPGRTRFMLSTGDFQYDVATVTEAYEDTMFRTNDGVSAFSVNFQKIAGVSVGHPEFKCSGERADGSMGPSTCKLPAGYFVEPYSMQSYDVQLVDMFGDAVVADSDSTVVVEGKCADADSSAVVLFEGEFSLDAPAFTVAGGAVSVRNVSFSNVCKKMQMSFTCAGAYCKGVSVTLEFGVRYADPDQTAPPSGAEISIACLSLGAAGDKGLADFADIGNDFEAAMDTLLSAVLPERLVALGPQVQLDYLCTVAAGECITDDERGDPAACIDFSVTPVPATPAPGNGTNGTNATAAPGVNATAVRDAVALQAAGSEAVSDFTVVIDAPLDLDAETFNVITTAIRDDLESDTSVLKAQSELFAAANASRTAATDKNAAPVPAPTPETPAPPVPQPPVPQPPVPTPPVPTPPVPTPPVPTPPVPTPVQTLPPVTTPASALAPSVLALVLAAVVGMLAML